MDNPFNTTDFANNSPPEFTEEEIEDGKTIKMPKEKLERWLAAMRSGEYNQGRKKLYSSVFNSYCCLGLEQKVNTGEVEDDGLPSYTYLDRSGIRFRDLRGQRGYVNDPSIHGFSTASGLNDSGKRFSEIADMIEKVAVGY